MEFVYVVKRSDLFDRDYPHGFVDRDSHPEKVAAYLQRIAERGFFVERRHAEQDLTLKQVIPYLVVSRDDEVLLLRRKSSQGEARLHDKLSIGVGGHINPEDDLETRTEELDVLTRGMRRELEEELHLSATPDVHWCGVLNDDSTPVGAVHFGVIGLVDARNVDVSIREQDKMEGQFVPKTRLATTERDEGGEFETWSAFLVDRLDAVLARLE